MSRYLDKISLNEVQRRNGLIPQLVRGLLAIIMLAVTGCAATIEREITVQASSNKLQIEKTTQRIINNFDAFMARNGVRNGAIAVSYDGRLVGKAGKNRTANEPARLASLSKAITAVCVMQALENTNYSVDTTLLELIPNLLSNNRNGLLYFGPITIEQLITHTSGIQTKHLSLQGRLIRRYSQEQKNWQLGNILQYKPSERHGKNYYYANANYLILGIIIEKLTNEKYENYCTRTVLSPLGINTAKLAPRWRILSSYAGWELSAVDYLRFVNRYFSSNWKSTFRATRRFEPAKNGPVKYGLGTIMRETNKGTRFWHTGSITWDSQFQNARFASFFAVYENGFSVSLNYSRDSSNGRGSRLENALFRAVNGH